MSATPPRDLSRYVEPPVDEAQIHRMWSAIAGRERGPRRPWLISGLAAGLLVLAATAAATAAAVLVRSSAAPTATLAGTLMEVGEKETVTVYDGVQVTLRPSSRLRWTRTEPERIEATLDHGEVEVDVPHVRSRVFVVHAGDFDVTDLGTHFVVGVTRGRVSVSVETGRVEIRRRSAADAPRTLGAGEAWTSAPPDTATVDPAAPDEPRPEPAPPAEPAATSPVPAHLAAASGRTAPSARDLLEAANTARLAGRPRDAAASFDALRRRYPSDARAGLAAFELGRLRLDALGDPALAVEAFDDAIALSPNAPFREDAEARRIDALDQIHSPRCRTEKDAYVARYPTGLHTASVGVRCAR